MYGKLFSKIVDYLDFWSGRRDSNPRLQPWQGCALPLSYARLSTFLMEVRLKL